MSKPYNKSEKKRRRISYIKRKKERVKTQAQAKSKNKPTVSPA
jgi:hypothetical protein